MMTKDELIAKLAMALIDVLEVDSPYDIVRKTGCSDSRAEEIFGLVRACLISTDYRGIVDINGLMGLLSEAQ